MKRVLLLIVLLLGLAVIAAPVQASTVTFELGSCFPGSTAPDPSDSPPWLTAVFEDGATPGTVTLTISAFFTGEIEKLYFNLDPTLNPAYLVFLKVDGTGPVPTYNKSADSFNLAGDGYYDIEFDWCSA